MTLPKLFIATGIYPPEAGGPATYLGELLPQFAARGWDIRVVTYTDGIGGGRPSDPFPVTRIPRNALPRRVFAYAHAAHPNLQWADLAYLHTLGMPLIHSRPVPRVVKIVGDIAWERAVRRGWIAPDTDIDAFQQATSSLAARVDKARRAREARRMDGVIVPSEYLKRMVVGWGVPPERIHIIYNALPPHAVAPSLTREAARARLGLPDTPILLTVGRLLPWKGVDHLIAALARAGSEAKTARLYIAGDGAILDDLKRLAAESGMGERVTFLGQVGRETMPLYMRAADYVALYSGYEGLSHTLLESLNAGTPVIASDKGGNPEVVTHNINGLLVPYVDVDAVTAALETAFTSGTRERLAGNAEHGMERFDFARMVNATDATLRGYLR